MTRTVFAALVLSMTASAVATDAAAQTVAAGPYYAMPSWDQKLACSTPATCPRFVVLSNWNNQAVLDRETGLVWERSASPARNTMLLAHSRCAAQIRGGRRGWRLPTVDELNSLSEPLAFPAVQLPPGHPFIDIQPAHYWSVTQVPGSPDVFNVTAFGISASVPLVTTANVTDEHFSWCVRGPGSTSQ
jgi:hypothetical protein